VDRPRVDWIGGVSPRATFRMTMVRQVMLSLTAPAKTLDPAFDYTRTFRGEGPVWPILMARPMNLLDPQFKSWMRRSMRRSISRSPN
jgi:hypothetical protein